MSNKIVLKKSSVVGKIPQASDLDYGELAINYADGVIYYKDADNNIQSPTATKLQNPRSISLIGDVTGSIYFDGSSAASIPTTVAGPKIFVQPDEPLGASDGDLWFQKTL